MKRIPTFLAGMLTAAVIGGLGVGALAASGAVTFNASNLMFNGQQISAKGEGYTLDNGCQAPASITYTDEKGGGTTYLPVRRISELLDVETGWDGATGSVTVGKAADTTAVPADYSDWSEEEEAAYQEFKGMWAESHRTFDTGSTGVNRVFVALLYTGGESKEVLSKQLNDAAMLKWYTRLLLEYTDADHPSAINVFFYENTNAGSEVAIVELYNGNAVIVE